MSHEIKMYLKVGLVCPKGLLFDVPHREKPMKAKSIIKKFPEFAKLFDGASEENTLCFYYKKVKDSESYVFIDVDSEEEVAELMGVKIREVEEVDEDDIEKPTLNNIQLKAYKDFMNDIHIIHKQVG